MFNKNTISFFVLAFLLASCTSTQKNRIEIERYPVPTTQPQEDQNLPIVYVSFIFTAPSLEARKFDNEKQMRKEIHILNQYFVDQNNNKIFKFKPYHYYSYQNLTQRKCDLTNQLNQPKTFNPNLIPAAVQRCFPHRNSKEVFFIIYDAYTEKLKYKDVTSWGFRNQGQPFILIDWERLNYQIQAATPHEMGHAFGLQHVCSPNATKTTPTNIMSSYDCKLGSGGLRNLGFTTEQLHIILQSYHQYP